MLESSSRFSSMAKAFSHINGNPMFYFPSRPNPNPHLPLLLPFNKPFKVTMSCNRSYWASINEDIEAHLKQAIPVREPLVVFEPMQNLTFAAPRNTAPALCVAACEMGLRDQALPSVRDSPCYAASFFHEHLPLTESSRPKSEVEHEYDRILRVISTITRSIGSEGMIHGQYYEVEPHESGNNESSHVEEIERVSEKYEGTLYACAAACGAIIGGEVRNRENEKVWFIRRKNRGDYE
ncbi:Actin cytoskeleton-regulatory complex protein end3, putative isoform 1 [Hibiscus syriacus]|uniref:Actin cytoskeleton-regulatory complex protein end3, putative isoform 1 n=1 Tax=Hibiscus syriacus TaxID=106335 RepID=A0A6A3BDQ4_HIBSY|nr:Actin cytoskeleton-regulatory complex protein end3, putative isoform 1 [Hibiscus syriacus]